MVCHTIGIDFIANGPWRTTIVLIGRAELGCVTSIDCRVDFQKTHTRLNAALLKVFSNSLNLLFNSGLRGDAEFCGLGLTPLYQAAMLTPLCCGTGLPFIIGATSLIAERGDEILSANSELSCNPRSFKNHSLKFTTTVSSDRFFKILSGLSVFEKGCSELLTHELLEKLPEDRDIFHPVQLLSQFIQRSIFCELLECSLDFTLPGFKHG